MGGMEELPPEGNQSGRGDFERGGGAPACSYIVRCVSRRTHFWGIATLFCLAVCLPARPLWGNEPDIRYDATVRAIQKVLPSVVNIATERVIQYHEWYDDLLRQFYGWDELPPRQASSISLGSGVIIDDAGYVLTNYHVVRRATRVQVKLWDGRVYDADPIVYTPDSDVALLRIRCKPGEKFKAIKFAADDDLLLGETVLALGNPYGLGGSVSRGILSAKSRRRPTGTGPLNVQDWLQTDAAINPGNSGGPLVDLRGEMIGMNVAVYRGPHGERVPGVGFSIPVKEVSAALSEFFTPELCDSLWLGAQFRDMGSVLSIDNSFGDHRVAEAGKLSILRTDPMHSGVVVRSVQPGSPAAKAGLRTNDEVLALNGQAPRGLIGFSQRLGATPGHKALLEVEQDGHRRSVMIQMVPFGDIVEEKLGVVLGDLSDRMAQRLGLNAGQALVVERVQKDGPVYNAGLRRGSLLRAIDGQTAGELRIVGEILSQKKAGEKVELEVAVPRLVGDSYLELLRGTVEVPVR
jgi:serine protease Do